MDSKWMIAAILCLNVFVRCDTSKLVAVVTIFRHGMRAPNFLYEADPYKQIASEVWPEGFAQLTKTGKKQHYEFGQWLRDRYRDFVPESYTNKFLYVISSNVDRCLMSVSSNLAGLFPPKGFQVWNENILWQPIPIHTRPEAEDVLLFNGRPCPKHARLLQEFYDSDKYKEYFKDRKFIFEYISNYTGMEVASTNFLTAIHDILTIESEYELLLPDWAKIIYPQHTLPIAQYGFSIPASTPELARLKSGPLLDYITTFMENAVSKPETSQKFLMMSGHDTTLTDLLTALDIFDNSWPEYASSVIFELREKKEENFVNIYFKNSTALYQLQLPTCTFDCQLSEFQKIIGPVRVNVTDWEKECTTGEENVIIPTDPRLG